jgi:hypothetical protein
MKSYVITVPKLFNSLDSHKVWIQADSTEGAVILLPESLPNPSRRDNVAPWKHRIRSESHQTCHWIQIGSLAIPI